jgi:hypothetical protein
MSQVSETFPASNPFSTRFIRPGALPYHFPAGEGGIDALVSRLRSNHWIGEIVGPHGSGKSTLLASLLPALQPQLPGIVSFSLHDGQRKLPMSFAQITASSDGGPQLVVVDGYEQLSRWHRWRLLRRCKRRGCGLLVTSHTPIGLPTLYSTCTTLELATGVIRQLLPKHDHFITDADIRQCFAERTGNLREALFALYDMYERRKRIAGH